MATVKDIIEQAYTKVNGEYEALTESSDDFRTYLSVLNQVMESWAYTPYVKWQSLFNMNYILPDKVTADRLVYPVADADSIVTANTPFDNVFFVDDDGVLLAKYKMTDQALFSSTSIGGVCAILAGELHIKGVTNEILGANIKLPVYVLPPRYTLASQPVSIDSVPWLVSSMAAFVCDASPVPFIARNADKYAKQAEVFMKSMRENNRHSQTLTIKRLNAQVGHTWASAMNVMTTQDL